jgi:hypothetical protein
MTLNRLFLICLALIGLTWIALFFVDVGQRADDKAFYDQKVAPQVTSGAAFAKGGPMDQWLERSRRRNYNAMVRNSLFFGDMVLFFTWSVATAVRGEIFWKKRNAPERAADPNAGVAIAELRRTGGILVARTGTGRHLFRSSPREVEIDAATEKVVFRGFTFTTSFIGNRRSAEATLSFHDILGGRIWASHGQHSLYLRTTAGKVTITDALKPFPELASVLLDAAEVNRSAPDRYSAALAREPRIETPWYGWLIFAFALLVVAGLAVFLWNLPAK